MADSAVGIERSYEDAYSPIASGSNSRGSRSPDDAVPQSDLASLIRAGAIKQEAGNYAEAADCFRLALELGDRAFGADNPDLIILLNDLTRLYLKQAAYGSAEPLLLRLLDLKRSKGEDHPEVATVLASLATVRQALGSHESAEQLWRRVLDIRERTLAPNHFATASALEHLGEALAARGNIRDAIAAFHRALVIREKTLGAEHPSLRVARERIADLELQASDDMLETTALADMPSTPERYWLLTPGNDGPPKYDPPSIATTPQIKLTHEGPTKAAATGDARPVREKKPALMIPLIPRTYVPPALPAEQAASIADRPDSVVVPAPVIAPASSNQDDVATLAFTSVDYRDALERVREEIENSETEPTISSRTGEWLSSAAAYIGKREVAAGLTLLAMALLGVAVATDTHALGEGAPAEKDISRATTPPASSAVLTAAAAAIPVASTNARGSTYESVAKPSKPRVADERATAKKASDKKIEQPARVAIPALSTAVLSRLDSAAAKAAAVGSNTAEQFNLQPAPAISRRRATFDDEESNTAQRAQLIGEMPTPKVPAQVMDVEGEVRVRFSVDSLGRPVLETFSVISSPNPLLTAAVRKVIPGMRFEPARTAGPDSKPIGDVVQIGFQFARSR